MDQFLISKNYSKLDDILFSKNCILVFSAELLEEFLEVARRPKFRRFFSATDIEELLETIQEYADFVEVVTKVEICRDTKDNFLLSLAHDGKADVLLTGDDDLLVLERYNKTTILTISDFLK
ncbi:putative toxin-antitoxin system toxin component, PIN family [Pedobacter steynii]